MDRILAGAGTLSLLGFCTITWFWSGYGTPSFMAGVVMATAGYLIALVRLARASSVSPRTIVLCLMIALACRGVLLTLPVGQHGDAIRYIWDARVQRFGLDPYRARPADPSLAWVHSDLTRHVDAASLPTIYPPVAQLSFRLVTSASESIQAFRVAALVCDLLIGLLLAIALVSAGRPLAWLLVYAWHPLMPLEGAAGAHVDLVGVLALVIAWLALLRRQTALAAIAFVAAILVKPLPLVLAPLFWRRVRSRDVALAIGLGIVATWIVTGGGLPIGSVGAFVDRFRFNGPIFSALEGTFAPRTLAGGAVLLGLLIAASFRATRPRDAPDAQSWARGWAQGWMWGWPMAAALLLAPVIYPWYLVWLVPFLLSPAASLATETSPTSPASRPLLAWTVSVLAVYPTWYLATEGAPWAVPRALLAIELGALGLTALWVLARHAGQARATPRGGGRQAVAGSTRGDRATPSPSRAVPRVAIIVPALNEEATIASVIRRVPYPAGSVTVVDNGSTDRTAAIAAAEGARVIREPRPGYGRACLAGVAATGDADIVVFVDADLSEDPAEVTTLVDVIRRDEADLVLGRRSGAGRPWHAGLGTTVCVWLINRLWGSAYHDLGPFRAIRRSSLEAIGMRDETWGWTIEMQVKAVEAGLRWIEVPVRSGARAGGRSKISGSLVGSIRAGARMLATILSLRLSRRARPARVALE